MIKKRLEALDALRGVAIISVMLYHYLTRYYQIYPQENQIPVDFYNGKYGVQLFFMISGFVIFMSLARIKKPIDFIVHRFIRLYPTFWFSVLFTFLIVFIFGLPGREVSFIDMIINLSMIPGQFRIASVDGVYWTLLYELKFYFWMLIILTLKKTKYIENIAIYFMLFIIISIIIGFNDTLIYKVLNLIFIFDYMSFFISGIVFYKIFYNEQSLKSYIMLFLAFSIGLYQNNYENTYMILNYTFSIGMTPILSTSIAMLVSLVIAIIVTRYIENTSIKYLKNLYKKNKKKVLNYLYNKKYLMILTQDK